MNKNIIISLLSILCIGFFTYAMYQRTLAEEFSIDLQEQQEVAAQAQKMAQEQAKMAEEMAKQAMMQVEIERARADQALELLNRKTD